MSEAVKNFGELLRHFRSRCRSSTNGGSLTQNALSKLIAKETEISYSVAAISAWERNNKKIPQSRRMTLIGLIKVLHEAGGIISIDQANLLLNAGNYRGLDAKEAEMIDVAWSTKEIVYDKENPRGAQALNLSEALLQAAISRMDKIFGRAGFSKNNPNLLAAFLNTFCIMNNSTVPSIERELLEINSV